MPVFLNNCKAREHFPLYGDIAAFFDFNLTGPQETMATDIEPGDECIVATPEAGGDQVQFCWWTFSHESIMPAKNDGIMYRVLLGRYLRKEVLPKAVAVVTEPYARFFNKDGNFKRQSVISTAS